ncbi:MAG TPA: cytochrome c, partial [Vicinamibacteria bacterium]|nr:cytochrome c [Vicinamibacteria bacterium]
MTRILVALAATLGAVTAGVARPAPTSEGRPDGRVLFNTHCAACHGAEAHGDGPWAASLVFRPPD